LGFGVGGFYQPEERLMMRTLRTQYLPESQWLYLNNALVVGFDFDSEQPVLQYTPGEEVTLRMAQRVAWDQGEEAFDKDELELIEKAMRPFRRDDEDTDGPEKPKGGAGSGNFSHLGRAGKVGGSGQGGGPVKDQEGKFIPGAVGKTLGVDTSSWDKSSSNAQWAMKKLYKMEQMAAAGHWSLLAAHAWKTNAQYPDKYKKAVLKAQEGIQALKTKAVNAPPAGTTPVANPPVPAPVPKWNKVGGQLGSNPGGTYEFEGKKFYVKFPADPDAARTEVLACKLYEAAGADVVKAHLVEIDGKTAVATEWLDTKAIDYGNAGQKQKAQENFAAHAWLNNWDAVGAVGDTNNMRMTADGKAVMVDAGGSLDRKATGGKKVFTDDPAAWDDMRNPNINPSAAKVFGSMTPDQLTLSANKILSVSTQQVDDLVDKYGPGTVAQKAALKATLYNRQEAILKKTEIVIQKPARVSTQQTEDPTEYVLTGTTPGGSMIYTAAAPASKVPMAVPPPPKVASYAQQHGDKMNAMYEAAQSGDIAKVNAIKTNPNASSAWPSKVHAYKMQVLAAMQSGGKADGNHVVQKTTATGQKVTIKSESFPTKPVFVSKNAAQKAANEAAVEQAWKHAEAGDLASLQGMDLPASPKLKQWHSELASELSVQLNPPPPTKSLSEGYIEATSHISGKSGKEGLQKIGYWTVLGDVGGVPSDFPDGGSRTFPSKAWDDGNSRYEALPGPQKTELLSYTGGGYSSINSSLRTESSPSASAMNAAKGAMNAALTLPTGYTLTRGHTGSEKEFKNLKPGMVVADKGVLSTKAKGKWSGNIQWKIKLGTGVKGVPARQFSHHGHENEVILPPNSRMLVTKVIAKKGGYFDVEAIALPTQDSQCCPP
jgi:hypothetical protein